MLIILLVTITASITVSASPKEGFDCNTYSGNVAGRNNLSAYFTWENDSFAPPFRDEAYTNGMKLRYVRNEECTDALFYT